MSVSEKHPPIVGALVALLALSSCGWFSSAPPHVVFVVVDTVRADRIGAFGYENSVTPTLDRLATEGVSFQRTISQAPWTRPSIGSMLTSRYPRDLGLYEEKHEVLPADALTLPEILGSEGFRTIGVTANPNLNRAFGFEQGFDVYVESSAVWQWMEPEDDQTRAPKTGLNRAPDRFREVISALDAETPKEAAQPHFVFIDVMEAHEWHKDGVLRPRFENLFKGRKDAAYLRTLHQVDHDLGEFLSAILSRPGWEDTLVVAVSDHGEGLTSHRNVKDGRFHGWVLYDSQIWVPWVMWSSTDRVPKGVAVQPSVRLLDVVPTLLGLLDVDAPADLRGTDVWPLVSNPEALVGLPEAFVVETRFRNTNKIGAVTREWSYIHNRDGHRGTAEHALQPAGGRQNGTKTDRSAEHPDVVSHLRTLVQTWEEGHAERPATRPEGSNVSASERAQLEALGYLQNDGDAPH